MPTPSRSNTPTSLEDTLHLLNDLRDVPPAHNARYFKTNPGDYAEKEQFLGIRASTLRTLCPHFKHCSLDLIEALLYTPYSESRLFALMLLVNRLRNAKAPDEQKQLHTFYLAHKAQINNWNLIDISAPWMVGLPLHHRKHDLIFTLAQAKVQWPRRIAIVSTLYFIKQGHLDTTFTLAEQLLSDPEDLMHKATGWMLRETGKVHPEKLRNFLAMHYAKVPRTSLPTVRHRKV